MCKILLTIPQIEVATPNFSHLKNSSTFTNKSDENSSTFRWIFQLEIRISTIFVRKFVNPEGFTVFTFQEIHLTQKMESQKLGEKETKVLRKAQKISKPTWCSHLSISWEAIFEVVAPSDVEDPRRPCGRHGHGALCHLGLKNRFCTWKMMEFRSRWFQALGGSVVYGFFLPVIRDFRSSFFWGCDYGSLVAFDLVFGPSKDESKATGDSMCPIDIRYPIHLCKASSQFLDDTKAHWQWWFRRSCRVSDVRVSNITSAIHHI